MFADRAAAGAALAKMVQGYHGSDALVLAIPAGGVPVAVEIAERLALPLDLAPVSKVLLPWTTESGYGAVAFDGSVWIDESAVARFGLSQKPVERAVSAARARVERRMSELRGGRPLPGLSGRPVILVDDGIAAGSTMRAAIAAVRAEQPLTLVVAVPTGHAQAVEKSRRSPTQSIARTFAAARVTPSPRPMTNGTTSAKASWPASCTQALVSTRNAAE